MKPISRDEIERIARLARLDVDPAALPSLTAQIARILDHVSQLAAVDLPETGGQMPVWLDEASLAPPRSDVVQPPELAHDPRDGAPAVRDGYYVVPRLEAMDQE